MWRIRITSLVEMDQLQENCDGETETTYVVKCFLRKRETGDEDEDEAATVQFFLGPGKKLSASLHAYMSRDR